MQSTANSKRPNQGGFLRIVLGMLGLAYFAMVGVVIAYV